MKKVIFIFLLLSRNVMAENLPISDCFFKSQSEGKVIKKNFVQKRYIRGLSKPIESSGDFLLFNKEKIEWLTTRPFPSKVTVSKDGFFIEGGEKEGGESSEKFDSSYFKELGSILVTLHSGVSEGESLSSLEKKFDLSCIRLPDGELLVEAKPITHSLKRVISQIRIKGKNFPLKIEVEDSRGDRTEINFR